MDSDDEYAYSVDGEYASDEGEFDSYKASPEPSPTRSYSMDKFKNNADSDQIDMLKKTAGLIIEKMENLVGTKLNVDDLLEEFTGKVKENLELVIQLGNSAVDDSKSNLLRLISDLKDGSKSWVLAKERDAKRLAKELIENAKRLAREMLRDAEIMSNQAIADAQRQADRLANEAQVKSRQLIREIQSKASDIVKDAQNQTIKTMEEIKRDPSGFAVRTKENTERNVKMTKEKVMSTYKEIKSIDPEVLLLESKAKGQELADKSIKEAKLQGDKLVKQAREAGLETMEHAKTQGQKMISKAELISEGLLKQVRTRADDIVQGAADNVADAVDNLKKVTDKAAGRRY